MKVAATPALLVLAAANNRAEASSSSSSSSPCLKRVLFMFWSTVPVKDSWLGIQKAEYQQLFLRMLKVTSACFDLERSKLICQTLWTRAASTRGRLPQKNFDDELVRFASDSLEDLQCERKPSDIAGFLNVVFHNITVAQSTSERIDHHSMKLSRNRLRSVPRRDGQARSKRYVWRPLHNCQCLLRPSGERVDVGFTILHLQHDNFELVPYNNRSRGAEACRPAPRSSTVGPAPDTSASMRHQLDPPTEQNMMMPTADTSCRRLRLLRKPVLVSKGKRQLRQKIYRLSKNDFPVSPCPDTGKQRLSLSGLRHHPHLSRVHSPSASSRQAHNNRSCLISGQLRPWAVDSPVNEQGGGLPRISASTRPIVML